MKTGLNGTFVISWSQTELDGLWSASAAALRVGATWRWTGEAVRVDGPTGVLTLGQATGEADLRKRAARSVRRLVGAAGVGKSVDGDDAAPLFDNCFILTDGRETWTVTLVETGPTTRPLCMFYNEIPPQNRELWLVSHNVDLEQRDQARDPAGGVICFTPGTMIMCENGPKAVEQIIEGDRIQTKDNGCQEVLWHGMRRITGARLFAMPNLAPVRLMAGALDDGIPDAGLLVSPDHRMMVRGSVAQDLFNTNEVLVAAKDLVNGGSIQVDRNVHRVNYHHLMLPAHEIVMANGVETESFHPASAALATMGEADKVGMFKNMPELADDPQAFGGFARRILTQSEAAILKHAA